MKAHEWLAGNNIDPNLPEDARAFLVRQALVDGAKERLKEQRQKKSYISEYKARRPRGPQKNPREKFPKKPLLREYLNGEKYIPDQTINLYGGPVTIVRSDGKTAREETVNVRGAYDRAKMIMFPPAVIKPEDAAWYARDPFQRKINRIRNNILRKALITDEARTAAKDRYTFIKSYGGKRKSIVNSKLLAAYYAANFPVDKLQGPLTYSQTLAMVKNDFIRGVRDKIPYPHYLQKRVIANLKDPARRDDMNRVRKLYARKLMDSRNEYAKGEAQSIQKNIELYDRARKSVSILKKRQKLYKRQKPLYDEWQQALAKYNLDIAAARKKRNASIAANKALKKARKQRTLKRTARREVPELQHTKRKGISKSKSRIIMANIHPWDKSYNDWKSLNAEEQKMYNVRHTRNGWQYIKPANSKRVQLSNGRWSTVVDSELGIPLGYDGRSVTSAADETGITSTDYVLAAFDSSNDDNIIKQEGCGHISYLEYSQEYQLLKVTFWNDAIVVYFRVPPTIAGELIAYAKSGVTSTNSFDGSERHLLGIRFWELIRIRGTLHGSRYRFEYLKEGSSLSQLYTRDPSTLNETANKYVERADNPKQAGRPKGTGKYEWEFINPTDKSNYYAKVSGSPKEHIPEYTQLFDFDADTNEYPQAFRKLLDKGYAEDGLLDAKDIFDEYKATNNIDKLYELDNVMQHASHGDAAYEDYVDRREEWLLRYKSGNNK